jgi:hypothetical protein
MVFGGKHHSTRRCLAAIFLTVIADLSQTSVRLPLPEGRLECRQTHQDRTEHDLPHMSFPFSE